MAAADAQFAIDIAARMGGGEQTTTELDALTTQLMGAGKGADHFQQAIKKVSADLTAAKAATEAANSALATGKDHYAQLEAAALQSAKAVERAVAVEEKASVKAAELAANALAAAQAEAVLRAEVESLNAAIAGAEDYLPPELALRAEKAAVALGKAEQKTLDLAAAAMNAETAVEAAGINIVDLALAAEQADNETNDYAITLRELEQAADGAAKGEDHLAESLTNVKKLSGHVDKTLAAQAESLEKLGGALGAVGGPLGTLGQMAVRPVQGFAKLSAGIGKANAAALLATVGFVALAAAVVAAGVAAISATFDFAVWAIKLADSELMLEEQTTRLSDNFTELFSGLDIGPVIAGMGVLADLFDKTSVAGQTIKFLFEAIFQPLIDQAENAAYVVEAFIIGFLIGATKLYIALKPLINTIAEIFGFEDTSLADILNFAKESGEIVAYVFAGLAVVFGVLLGAVLLVGAAIGGMIALMIMLPSIIGNAAAAVMSGLVDAFKTAVDFIKSIDFVAIGVSIMQGLASGISGAAGAVFNAITGAVKGAINAAKSLLGIASPSKVFEDIGGFTGEGFVSGVEAENDNAQSAMASMADPAGALASVSSPLAATASPADAAPAAAASGGGGGGPVSVTLHFHGVKDAEAAIPMIEEALTKILEGDASSVGGASQSEAA